MVFRLLKLTALLVIASGIAILGLYAGNNISLPPEFSTSTVPTVAVGTTTVTSALSVSKPTTTPPVKELPLPKITSPVNLKPVSLPAAEMSTATPALLIVPEFLIQKEINLSAIVLIRCLFQSQYFKESVQPWNEQEYNVGTGILVTPGGHILTARHILEVRKEMLSDPAGRIWTLQKCDVAQTDKDRTAISSIGFWGQQDDLHFKPAKIIFKSADEDYRDSAGLDFAILKVESEDPLPAIKLLPKPVSFKGRELITIIGYPGRESVSPQKLERFDSEFSKITFYKESSCDGSIKPCGLRYFIKRNPYLYEPDFWKDTELGIITPYFRGGFSGGPAFYKGNLIGIVTHGVSGDKTESRWDEAFVLISYDIVEKLKTLMEL